MKWPYCNHYQVKLVASRQKYHSLSFSQQSVSGPRKHEAQNVISMDYIRKDIQIHITPDTWCCVCMPCESYYMVSTESYYMVSTVHDKYHTTVECPSIHPSFPSSCVCLSVCPTYQQQQWWSMGMLLRSGISSRYWSIDAAAMWQAGCINSGATIRRFNILVKLLIVQHSKFNYKLLTVVLRCICNATENKISAMASFYFINFQPFKGHFVIAQVAYGWQKIKRHLISSGKNVLDIMMMVSTKI